MTQVIGGRYAVIRALGEGAFGRTFLAHDAVANRHVAIKLLDATRATEAKAFELFEREAAVLRTLRHQGIPEVHDSLRDVWEGRDSAFLVMEFIEGESLADRITRGQHADHGELMRLLLDLLSILDYLHDRIPPVLHRDIKPANVIVRPNGAPTLVDFGSVRNVFHGPDESGSTVAGTYGYMPYEQYMGQASPSSDLYALGATMLHVITGRPPREFMTGEGRLGVPDALPVDARVHGVLTKLLRSAPADRFPSAAAVRAALLSESVALAPRTATMVAGRRVAAPLALPPAPRPLVGAAQERFTELAHPWWRFADSASKTSGDGVSVSQVALLTFFTAVSFGLVPLMYMWRSRARRRRFRRMLMEGTPGVALITAMAQETDTDGVKMTRVDYEFAADGNAHRDSDTVMPTTARRWRAGDEIEIVYVPARGYDSTIISIV